MTLHFSGLVVLYSIPTSAIQTTHRVMFHDTTSGAKISHHGSALPRRKAEPWARDQKVRSPANN